MLSTLKYALPVALLATFCFADTICTEDAVSGCSGSILTASPAIIVGSDGESPFDPLGLGFDQSDYIHFAAGTGWTIQSGTPGWQPFTLADGSYGWALPANLTSIGCGIENETTCEPTATFYFTPGSGWNAGTPENQYILDADGSVSDYLHVANFGPNGEAAIYFASDPSFVGPVPEPGSVLLLLTALSAVGLKFGKKGLRGNAPPPEA